jgi:NitT/TauT family transport system ATP-binding protein
MMEVGEVEPAVVLRTTTVTASFEDVSFSYDASAGGAEPILEGFDLSIHEGECFCLLGPSGCGKTTALRLLAGFDRPAGGAVSMQGREVSGPGKERAVVFQGDDSLFPWLNARDNVAFGLKLRGVAAKERTEVADHYLRLVGLSSHAGKYPSQLSGGMKQRIQIARVLANDPAMLLMDEPFAALDAQTRSELQDEVVRIWGETGKTILFITHDISEALLLGSRIGVMTHGPRARMREIIDVPFPMPRSRAIAEFGDWYERINHVIRDEVAKSRSGTDVG